MQDILLSKMQYKALVTRLDEINDDVTSIRQKSYNEVGYIDNHDLLILLQVTNRTVQRWRKSGQLPYKRLGHKFYYRADVILDSFTVQSDKPVEVEFPPPEVQPSENPLPFEDYQFQEKCEKCPLYQIMNDEDESL